MKRFLLFFIAVLFLAGCSFNSTDNIKVLECNSSKPVGSTLSEQNYKIYFKDEKVDRLSINIGVSLDTQDDTTRDNLESDVSSAFDSYKNRDGISYSSDVTDNGFTVSLDVNFSKLSDEDKSSISFINSEKSFDEIKLEFESDGFSCK